MTQIQPQATPYFTLLCSLFDVASEVMNDAILESRNYDRFQ